LSAGGLVEGDLRPLGQRDSREEVVYFFGGALTLGWLAGKWLRYSVYIARTVFPGPIQCVGIPMLGLCRRCKLVGYFGFRIGFAWTPLGQRHEARFRLGGICTLLSYSARRVVVEYKKFNNKKKKKNVFSY